MISFASKDKLKRKTRIKPEAAVALQVKKILSQDNQRLIVMVKG